MAKKKTNPKELEGILSTYVEKKLKEEYIKLISSGGKIMCETIIGLIDNEGYGLEEIKKFCQSNLSVSDELFLGKESE